MQARIGDRMVAHGHRTREPDRDTRFLTFEDRTAGGRSSSVGAVAATRAFFFPGPDASVQHFEWARLGLNPDTSAVRREELPCE